MVFDFIDDGEDISQALVAQTYHHHLKEVVVVSLCYECL
jgi:hypothetical protein